MVKSGRPEEEEKGGRAHVVGGSKEGNEGSERKDRCRGRGRLADWID